MIELDLPAPPQPRRYAQRRGHAAQPGDGPVGETCGSCAHVRRTSWTKCGLIPKPPRTRNGDVRLRDPACVLWSANHA